MPTYFRQLPDIEYPSRLPGEDKISEYVTIKNLFKRGKIRDDIFGNLAFFTKYKIVGDDRPDNVAYNVYEDETLDWLILLSNNIINVNNQWPLTQNSFHNFLLSKYGTEEAIQDIHHYETIEVRDSNGVTIVPEGLTVDIGYSVSYFDSSLSQNITRGGTSADLITTAVTNYVYEVRLEEAKRNIFILKPEYLNVILNDMDLMMRYRKGSTQYVSETLKRADNIRLYS
jgi:hypothetical protein